MFIYILPPTTTTVLMVLKRITWDASWKAAYIRVWDDDSELVQQEKLTEFFNKTNISITNNEQLPTNYQVPFFVSKSIASVNRVIGLDDLCEIGNDDWVVVMLDNWGVYIRLVGIFSIPTVEYDLKQRMFNELVSVPAGRFKGLLVDGGVEYQRQMAQLEQLSSSTFHL